MISVQTGIDLEEVDGVRGDMGEEPHHGHYQGLEGRNQDVHQDVLQDVHQFAEIGQV